MILQADSFEPVIFGPVNSGDVSVDPNSVDYTFTVSCIFFKGQMTLTLTVILYNIKLISSYGIPIHQAFS